MSNRPTMKDIAAAAGVSPATVHIALSGKPGVRPETREHIRQLAERFGYRVNNAAAALSRKTLHIAAAVPVATRENRYYYTYLWEAIRDYAARASDWNIELVEVPYALERDGDAERLNRELDRLLEEGRVDGLLTLAHVYQRGEIEIARFVEKKIPVVLVNSDLPGSGRLCCVTPDYDMIGCMMGELTVRLLPPQAHLLLCSGDPQMPPCCLVAEAFAGFIRENAPGMRLHWLGEARDPDENLHCIAEALRTLQPDGCASVSARCTAQLGEVIRGLGLAGRRMAIGCDLFPESLQFLKDGVFTCLVHKKPYEQAYLAMRYLAEYIMDGTKPAAQVVSPGMEMVFRSNCAQFDNPGCRLML